MQITSFSLPRLQISIISTQFLYLPYKSTSFPPNSLIRHINGLIFSTSLIIPAQFLYLPYKFTSFPPNSLVPHINHVTFPTPPKNLYYFHRISSPHTNLCKSRHFPYPAYKSLSFPHNFSTSPTNLYYFHPIRLYPILITSFSLPRLQIPIISTQFAYTPY